ncbi:MAG: glutamine--tRNA ligase/YqeY domain fusion protein [Saprospiraceae bacterium]|nr:glutamine--tRNA ligase/YqeY domain fusion protein [Saprospiraceae bacterium]MCB0623066.1 glutamine--tRNA ligase/YqeY domain fusion protein [Saprospiraceae bacterium]MCB0676764.1 glutamine--tRNA ligase/YqeY domain fusion protein [Saprospiraceae bacterium]MCB0681311.1 glutamine--tRNA ligase/YqeY domain fusion protein [Saprospiraceae bacterium]
MTTEPKESLNFIEQIIEEDIKNGKHGGRVHTRFPPEPNGYLHIGHAKAICINFETAAKYGGKTNLRFDDTNPVTEDTEYVDAIRHDIHWLGFDWEDREFYASDYFGQLYEFALDLIRKGLAYVDDSTPEQIAQMKGTPTEAGTDSPYRARSVEENLDLFERMKNGEYPDGSRVLRARIDMSSPNMWLRDPVLYRIKHAHHHRTGDEWCIYPMYDFAHGQSDSIEGITHSLCSLEFRHHRPLYDWMIEKLEIFPSRQIEFARMNVAYMITSKRRLLQLVNEKFVSGWDDPRMPTLSGMRRRGYPPAAIRTFCDKAGVAKRDNVIEFELLESCVRDELNRTSKRVMGVLDPVKLLITNYPEDQVEEVEVENNPEDEQAGNRLVPFSRELYIEREDFMEDPPKKFFRLGPGRDVRLKSAYIIRCDDFVKDEAGELTEIHCTYYPDSRSGADTSGIKAKGTLHWVSAAHALEAEVRVYDRLFTDPSPTAHEGREFIEFFNHDSLGVIPKAYVEPSLADAQPGEQFQFLRKGYFATDLESQAGRLVFNRTATLKDTWAKVQNK